MRNYFTKGVQNPRSRRSLLCGPQKRRRVLTTPLGTVPQVFLGAAAVHSNGTVMSRIGSATVAMAADASNVPVIICCETYKFVAKVPGPST